MPSRKYSDEIEAKVADGYRSGKSRMELAVEFGMSTRSVGAAMVRNGIAKIKNNRPFRSNRRLPLNEQAFDDLSNPDAAYWAGFSFADLGHSDKHNHIILRLAEVDDGHVKKFKSFLKSGHKLIYESKKSPKFPGGKTYKSALLQFRSRHMLDRLYSIGLKSFNRSVVSDELATCPHFWRGLIDGDGTIEASGSTPGKSPPKSCQWSRTNALRR